MNKDDWDGLLAIAKSQVKEGAHMLDVNADYVRRDHVSFAVNLKYQKLCD
ncbi:MAG: dihydropteroate synthase [Symploca sp. SIO1C2]|nr:dihydropteroate synthase [Symploca sp. SIO1C2]